MRRQEQYKDSGVNPMMQQQNQYPPQQQSGSAYSTQDRMRQADTHYPGESQSVDGQWHWDRDHNSEKNPKKISSYSVGYTETEGQGKAGAHSYMYEARRGDSKHGTEKVGNTDLSAASTKNSALEGEFKDNAALPQTIDALEQRFSQDFTKLLKEQHAAEDAELSRHRERLNEINGQYQEKLVALRAKQDKMREEFLRKESQSRFQQYQQFQSPNSMAHFQNDNPPPPLPGGAHQSYPSSGGYSMEATQRMAGYHGSEGYPGGYSMEATQRTEGYHGAEGYSGGYGRDTALYPTLATQYESGGHAHGRGLEPHYPGGRAYNAGGRQH